MDGLGALMSFRVKFNLVLLLTFALALVTATVYYKHEVQKATLEEVKYEATLALRAAFAVRSFSSKHISPNFDQLPPDEFRAGGIPSFASTETLRILFESYPGYHYKEAVLNPLNLANVPQEAWLKEVIEKYRDGSIPYADENAEVHIRDQTLHLLRPIQIQEASCMACHGRVQDAPAAMVKIYGSSHGYGWKLNDIVGVQIVTIPLERSNERSAAAFRNFLWPLVGVFALLFITLNILLQYWVLNPLSLQNVTLNRLASTDALTGLMNRRAFMDSFQMELDAARYHGTPLILLVFDLDHFKAINDTHGHAQGDMVLRTTATTISQALRSVDHLARIGGEEFALLLPATTLAAAKLLADNLRRRMEQQATENPSAVTGSFGLAQWDGKETREHLLKRADDATYAAKAAGRNCVMVATAS
ncbi:diguanylate cyclase domain-containing protein [Undibacterium sp. Ji50W]|uniref:diguanylate cyclase domain-containing protein n=1 Tax=Undibacterium sp. Ji50W TaxID=3413041 RepID=UPI003BF0AF41